MWRCCRSRRSSGGYSRHFGALLLFGCGGGGGVRRSWLFGAVGGPRTSLRGTRAHGLGSRTHTRPAGTRRFYTERGIGRRGAGIGTRDGLHRFLDFL